MSRHPARAIDFGTLYDGLQEAKAAKLVSEQVAPDGLRLYCYSQSCVYDRAWSSVTLLARGLILDPAGKRVVATPFPKFFNVGERADPIPDLAFETFEKLDGSLIILFHHAGEWRCATKGSFASDQAKWAAAWTARHDLTALDRATTYLAEGIYPENRIVVHYAEPAMVLLAAYDGDGIELGYDALQDAGRALGWRCAKRHAFDSVSALIEHAGALPASEEGFVLRFSDGLRLKVKGDEYRRIHALISRITPLAMWEAMMAADDLPTLRRQLPEEFWGDFDAITATLSKNVERLVQEVAREAATVAELDDKAVGLQLDTFPAEVRRFIFPYRKQGGDLLTAGRTRDTLFRSLRPTGNRLDGYTPSYAMNRVFDEAT